MKAIVEFFVRIFRGKKKSKKRDASIYPMF
jgi:hypothetical protein